MDDRAGSEHEEDIEDIRAEDVTERDVAVMFGSSNDGCCQFGQGGSQGNDGQTDNRFAYSHSGSQINGTLHNQFSSHNQSHKTANYQTNRTADRDLLCVWHFVTCAFLRVLFGVAERVIEKIAEDEQ